MSASPQATSGGGSAHRSSRPRPGAKQIIAAVIAILAIVFIAQNRERVSIDFFTASLSCPLWLLLLIMAAVGMLLAYGFMRRGRRADGRR
ncbi:lipopolysaccharide assembly protein LapA domain-containing protein [Phaeacidiphilus oryzae]|uniref:lipopolysaccharide assembly protein LapA domain-containing protein n=1 Tax=Phaeacidiphilus oryzae TaxID=348818 RepID=UPI000689F628|nr:lipopolysaccharide assembly protein LapA domain-containing protein [Phaeacidiphilus oryzae]